MSAPFDPSKLDLDISGNSDDSGKNQTSNEKSPEPKVEKVATNPVKKAAAPIPEENDILGSINTDKKVENTETMSSIQEKENDVLADVLMQEDTKQVEGSKTTQDPLKEPETEEKTITQIPDVLELSNTPQEQKTQDIVEMIESENQTAEELNEEEEKQETDTERLQEITEKKLIDINLTSLEDIATLVDEKEYDYVLIEPEDMQVKVTFKQDNIDRDIKYIKFPVYTTILFAVKQKTKMEIENTQGSQEGKGEIIKDNVKYKVVAKTAAGQNGEKVWLKTQKDTSQKEKKVAKKASLSMVLGFLGAILFVGLVLGGAFIAFIVLNAKTVEDVKFFASLGINLNDINTFISQIVTIIFSILLFICTAALSVSLFKFFLTKKAYKRKKVFHGIVASLLLILTFGTASAWMIIDRKIDNLPNWQQQAYGDLKIFDNDLLISQEFTADQALLAETENLIGPVTLQFDLENFQDNQARKGNSFRKYSWNFGDEVIETLSPSVTRTFDEVGNFEISVIATGDDIQGEEIEQNISNIPAVSISHVIGVEESITKNGGKKLVFDATTLENLGKLKWYFKQPLNENGYSDYPEWEEVNDGYEFYPGKVFFDELFVGISIENSTINEPKIDKIIVISPDEESEINGEIDFKQDIDNELSFEFFVKNPSTGFSNGFIENYKWIIGEKTYTESARFSDSNQSPSIEHTFESYGEHLVQVELTDTKGKTEIMEKTITIQKRVDLKFPLKILDNSDDSPIEDIRYEKKSYEYFIDSLGVPTKLKLDARIVRPESALYSLKDVSWDVKNDGDIDAKGKTFTYEVSTEGNHIIVAEYEFVHRKISEDVIRLKEYIYIEGVKKEAILDLQIEKSTNYAPVTVRFDASKSFIKGDDIVKFVYDYGDGTKEERDAINPGHKYSKAGDYTVKLTVIGSTGKTYSLEKKLILLPPPQTVKISTSLKKAPIGQGIDFSSAESEGQIIEYFWDFGDGSVSTQANPTHSYKKAGTYNVSLRVDFSNNNSITDEMEIEIVEE